MTINNKNDSLATRPGSALYAEKVVDGVFDDGAPLAAVQRTWSNYQLAVFDNVANGTGHTVVKAVAGSGKTTTVVEALKYIPRGLRTLFVAFNKAIAEELKKRVRGIEVSTLHSYGLRIITRALGRLRINADRVDQMIVAMYRDGSLDLVAALRALAMAQNVKNPDSLFTFDLRNDLKKTVSLAKGTLSAEEADIDALIDTYGIQAAGEEAIRKAFIADVLKILLRCSFVDANSSEGTDGCIDFDDMIWLPIVLDLPQPKFDRVFVDETQDLNKAQIELTMRAVAANGRICAVGDPRQAIYGFRGADSSAVDNVVDRLKATVLPLSVCYRCSKAVIRKAQEVMSEIECAPNASEGAVYTVMVPRMKREVRSGDFVLSRTNAPLVSLCMQFLKEGRPASIQGRDVGASLAAFVRKSKANTIAELRNYTEKWRDVECERLAAKNRDTQAVEDRAECVLALSEDAPSVNAVLADAEALFADKDGANRIVLSTTHKAKGLERERVWLLESTYMRRPGDEEANLYYVAITRAQKTLFLVEGKVSDGDRGAFEPTDSGRHGYDAAQRDMARGMKKVSDR